MNTYIVSYVFCIDNSNRLYMLAVFYLKTTEVDTKWNNVSTYFVLAVFGNYPY